MFHVGTHTSMAGGISNAFGRSASVGGDTLQIFAKSPRGWKIPKISEEELQLGEVERTKNKQIGGLVHSNYLINLSKPADEIGAELDSVLHDFEVAQRLGYDAVNVHIGKEKGRESKDEAMQNMVVNLKKIFEYNKKNNISVQFVFENTAGQGSEIGSSLEEMIYFRENYLKDLPVKFCIDTAHCQGGGIDVSKRDEFIEKRDKHIGIDNLYCIHLNDAKVPLGAHLDRHAPLGKGFIGWKGLIPVIQRAYKNERHMYIETPEPELRPEEIKLVRKVAEGDIDRVDEFHKKHYRTVVLKKFENIDDGLF